MEHVVVVNPIELGGVPVEDAVAMWDRFASFFARQPGYVSAQLHQSLDDSTRFGLVTVARWESAEAFMQALENPELAAIAGSGPALVSAPGLYRVIRG